MQIYTLGGAVPLTKTYEHTSEGIIKSPYPHLAQFTSHEHNVSTIKDLYVVVQAAASAGHCLIKGELNRPLNNESRAGSTESMGETQWVCFDLDDSPYKQPDEFMKAIGYPDVSYVFQPSAGFGITTKALGAHIFVLLDKRIKADLLKLWLTHINLSTAELKGAITLTKSAAALSYALDITCCQNDKLIYIADPVLKGFKKAPARPAIRLVEKAKPCLSTTDIGYIAPDVLQKDVLKLRNELREKAGLTTIKHKTRMMDGFEVQPGLSAVAVTGGPLYARGMVYFNFNGGDSWAYYHPENNFEYIHNFKGEPVYKTSELMPDYYKECVAKRSTSQPPATNDEAMPFVFRDLYSATFWNGFWFPAENRHELYQAKTEKQLEHFMLDNNKDMGDYVPVWRKIFDPSSFTMLDMDARMINTWKPSKLMIKFQEEPIPLEKCGPETWATIRYILIHAYGRQPELQEYLYNWLACVVQYRTKVGTAWLVATVPGTGKGFIATRILAPMLGEEHVIEKRMRDLLSQFNSYLTNSIIAVIDEVDIANLNDTSLINADLKNFITEETLSIRGMHQEAKQVRSYTNFILYSNEFQAMKLQANDRRMNVAEKQTEPLIMTDEMVAAVKEELYSFFCYLMQRTADKGVARKPFENEARRELIELSVAAPEQVGTAIMKGNVHFMIDQLADRSFMESNLPEANMAIAYRDVVEGIMLRAMDHTDQYVKITRDHLRVIFEYCIGATVGGSPTKFAQFLRHKGINLKQVWVDNQNKAGIEVKLNASRDELFNLYQQYFPHKARKLKVVK